MRTAYIREPDELRNSANQILNTNDYREWVGGGGITWNWARDNVVEAGWTERRLRTNLSSGFYDSTTGQLQVFQTEGSVLPQSGYVQGTSSFLKGRVHMLGGLRWDRLLEVLPKPFSPQISVAVRVAKSTELQFGAGRYTQFSDFAFGLPPGYCIGEFPLPPRSDHYTAAVEQHLGENARIRLEAFDRQDSYTLGAIPPSQVHSASCPALQPLPGGTFQRDYSRGVQLVLQRRSANRLSGWLGYTLVQARERQYQISTPYKPYTLFFNTGTTQLWKTSAIRSTCSPCIG